jgi:hypothetical protein
MQTLAHFTPKRLSDIHKGNVQLESLMEAESQQL